VGETIALVQDGDAVTIDAEGRVLQLACLTQARAAATRAR
jgi:dihydroxyacid dehydratase/phosphogluconate dehydratase